MKWDMPIRPIESGPLTDQEIEELHAFLLAEDGPEHPMDFYTFDGFICAVLSGPKTIMPSEWLRWVWDQEQGEQPPEFSEDHCIRHRPSVAARPRSSIASVNGPNPLGC